MTLVWFAVPAHPHRPMVGKQATRTVGAAYPPQRERAEVRRTAQGDPRIDKLSRTQTGSIGPDKRDEQCAVGREIAPPFVHPPADPLSVIERVSVGVPHAQASPGCRSTTQ